VPPPAPAPPASVPAMPSNAPFDKASSPPGPLLPGETGGF
jgi:hypothetical protein